MHVLVARYKTPPNLIEQAATALAQICGKGWTSFHRRGGSSDYSKMKNDSERIENERKGFNDESSR